MPRPNEDLPPVQTNYNRCPSCGANLNISENDCPVCSWAEWKEV